MAVYRCSDRRSVGGCDVLLCSTGFLENGSVVVTKVAAASQVTKEIQSVNSAAGAGETQPYLEKIADRIYQLESSSGLNDQKCERIGKHNGYGYRMNSMETKCYGSDNEARIEVVKWFEKKLQSYSLPEAVCGYNLGFSSEHLDECMNQSPKYPYYLHYLTVL